MKNFLKFTLINALVFSTAFASDPVPASEIPETPTVVIVGNNRSQGYVGGKSVPEDHELNSIYRMAAASASASASASDFVHRESFPGKRVISMDLYPCTLPGITNVTPTVAASLLQCCDPLHITGDFLKGGFFSNSLDTVMFEWFPADKLVDALRVAYTALKPDGDLIVDFHFNVAFLQTDSTEIELNEAKISYPFSLVLDEAVRSDIVAFLSDTSAKPSGSLQISCNVSLNVAAEILGKTREEVAIAALKEFRKDGLGALRGIIVNTEAHLFASYYHWFFSRKNMESFLKQIGFCDIFFERHDVNPYNRRRHATIIRAKKPMAAAASPEDKPATLEEMLKIASQCNFLTPLGVFSHGAAFAFKPYSRF